MQYVVSYLSHVRASDVQFDVIARIDLEKNPN